MGRKKKFKIRGVTLVELMIAMALSTMVAGTIVAIISTGTRLWKISAGKYASVQADRVVMDRIVKELEEASHLYAAEGNMIAFYRQGYSTSPLDATLENALNSDSPYDPKWKGKKYDIVKFYYTTTVVDGLTRGVIRREVWDGYTPTIKLAGPVAISDPETDIKALKFVYFNYDNYLDKLPLPLQDYTKVVDCWIAPDNYPQNLWEKLTWIERPSTTYIYTPLPSGGADIKMQVRGCTPTVWWDDALPKDATARGNTWEWTSLPDFNPYSGEKSHTEELYFGVREHYFDGAGAGTTMAVSTGDWILTHAYIDPNFPPREIMLSFYNSTNSVWVRAYWCSSDDRTADVTPDLDEDGDGDKENDGLIPWGIEGNTRFWMGTLPEKGKWITLGVPAEKLGLEGKTVNGQSFAIYSDGFGGKVYWDKCELCTWGAWIAEHPFSYYSTDPPQLSITGLQPSLYFQYKSSLLSTYLTVSPVMDESIVTHSGGLWTLTSDDEWNRGSFTNTITEEGSLKLGHLK